MRHLILATAALAVLVLPACGSGSGEIELKLAACTKDRMSAEAKYLELQAKVELLQKDLNALKAAAVIPTPAGTPPKK